MAETRELKGSRKKVYEIIAKREGIISITEIRGLTKVKYNTLRGAIISLTKLGLIKRVGRGQYKPR